MTKPGPGFGAPPLGAKDANARDPSDQQRSGAAWPPALASLASWVDQPPVRAAAKVLVVGSRGLREFRSDVPG